MELKFKVQAKIQKPVAEVFDGVYNPKNVRQAMMPLRRVAGAQGIAAVGLLWILRRRAGQSRPR